MPRVLRHRPEWLKRNTPGHSLFSRPAAKQTNDGKANQPQTTTQSRKIVASGTQLFVAVQNELRWSDLLRLKDAQELSKAQFEQGVIESTEDEASQPFRLLKVPIYDDIEQLALSPNGAYLAIATRHTVYIALVPDSYHLTANDDAPLRLKTYQVGPTTHIHGHSPIVSLLWHPLGVEGSCLTTITEDASVRLWEFDQQNRMSVNSAALALDLKRLANGNSSHEDFTPSKYGARSFSAELPYMVVAAACYGGSGGSDIQRDCGWSTSTLWVAMEDGAIYALCPLLPSKFAASPKMLDELAASVSVRAEALKQDPEANDALRAVCDQCEWLGGVEKHPRGDDFDLNLTVYQRPSRPGPIPMLQGPYNLSPNPNALDDITDLFAMPRGSATQNESEGDLQQDSMPVDALCVATSDGCVHICVDMEGTSAKWLPTTRRKRESFIPDEGGPLPVLLALETLEVDMSSSPSRLMFTTDIFSNTSFFVTHSQGVTHVDMEDLMDKLAGEIEGSEAGTAFRLKMLMDSPIALEQDLIRFARPLLEQGAAVESAMPTACVAIRGDDLGDLVLTVLKDEPHVAYLDYSAIDFPDDEIAGDEDMDHESDDLENEVRETYEPAPEFYQDSSLPSMMKQFIERNPRRSLKDPMRISTFDLEMLTAAHPVLAKETQRINDAVSRLFGRTQRLQQELLAQLQRAHEMNEKIEEIVEDEVAESGGDDGLPMSMDGAQRRIEHANERQEELETRFEELKTKVSRLDKRPLNAKEKEWIQQVDEMDHAVGREDANNAEAPATMLQRLDQVNDWKQQLIEQCKSFQGDGADKNTQPPGSPWSKSGGRRRDGTGAIRDMLERERAMVDATRKKLDELLAIKLAD